MENVTRGWSLLFILRIYCHSPCIFACVLSIHSLGFPSDAVLKNLPANVWDAGDIGSIPGSGRSRGGGNGNPPQHSCLENSMDRGVWLATVYEGHRQLDMTEHARSKYSHRYEEAHCGIPKECPCGPSPSSLAGCQVLTVGCSLAPEVLDMYLA